MGNLFSCHNGNCLIDRSCYKCNIGYGDYGDYSLNYVCLIIGKGKYNGKYMCFNCIYDVMEKQNQKENYYDTFNKNE
tara:strand:- start:162 stop:392 length:231 start_codon:yes stop_codon:yes gene_type:complete